MEMNWRTGVLTVALMGMVTPLHAELSGMLSGRSADLSRLPDMSVEVGFITGEAPSDGGDVDYQHIGGRLNYRIGPGMMAYGDVGQTTEDFGNAKLKGTSFGGGMFYQMDGIFESTDFAVKGSYHQATLKDNFKLKVTIISVEALFSSRESVGQRDMYWYANMGIHRYKTSNALNSSETEIGFGGGLIFPTEAGQVYAGLDKIDEITFGIGYRHFLASK